MTGAQEPHYIETNRGVFEVPLGIPHLRTLPLVAFFSALLLLTIAFLALTPYQRRATAVGEVIPAGGLSGVIVPRDGYVSAVFVKDGQQVAAGSPILAVSVETRLAGGVELGSRIERALEDKGAAYAGAEQAQAVERREASADIAIRRNALLDEIRLIEQTLAVANERLRLSEERVAKSEPFYKKGYISGFQFQQYQDAVNSGKISVNEAEQKLSQARRDFRQLSVEERQLAAKADQDKSSAAVARADLLSARAQAAGQRTIVLVAERSGQVTALTAKIGAPVKSGDTLAIVLPVDSQLRAEVWASSKAIAFVKPGDLVSLTFDAYPRETFGTASGRVQEVAQAPNGGAPDHASLYSIGIQLSAQSLQARGRNWRFVPGMKVEATIVLEQRTLLQWLLGIPEARAI